MGLKSCRKVCSRESRTVMIEPDLKYLFEGAPTFLKGPQNFGKNFSPDAIITVDEIAIGFYISRILRGAPAPSICMKGPACAINRFERGCSRDTTNYDIGAL